MNGYVVQKLNLFLQHDVSRCVFLDKSVSIVRMFDHSSKNTLSLQSVHASGRYYQNSLSGLC